MKKTVWIIVSAVLALAVLYVAGSGFLKEGTVFVQDVSASDDGTGMTLTVGVGDSVGHIRELRVHRQEGGKLYLDGISAFGGVNGALGAKNTFVIPLDPETNWIGVYRNHNAYQAVLEKDTRGEWKRVKKASAIVVSLSGIFVGS